MSLIEGVGDEVTAFFVIVLLLLVICLAWISTNIRDIPFFSVIIVELTQGRRRVYTGSPTSIAEQAAAANGANAEQNPTEQENDSAETPGVESEENQQNMQAEAVEDASKSSIGGENETLPSESIPNMPPSQNVESDADVESDSNLTETELRRRRIDFFQKQTSPGSHQSTSDNNDRVESETSSLSKSENSNSPSGVQSHENQDSSSHPIDTLESRSRTDVIQSESRCSPSSQSGVSRSDSNIDLPDSDYSRGNNSGVEEQSESVSDRGDDSLGNQINIRLKYLNDTQRSVIASPRDTIGQFRRANFAAELSENKLVRFIFNGQDLRNDANTLQAYNIVDNSVIHCLITQDNRNNATPMMHQDNGFDIGMLMLPLFGLLICVVWYLRFEYKQFFTATSTVSLIGVTFLFIAAVLASWEGHRRGHAHEHVD